MASLLDSAERALAHCKAWVTASERKQLTQNLGQVREMKVRLEARAPQGQLTLPVLQGIGYRDSGRLCGLQVCACCGCTVAELRKCSACRAVGYCSRECQAKHWKAAGGHKQECGRLAAASR